MSFNLGPEQLTEEGASNFRPLPTRSPARNDQAVAGAMMKGC